MPEIWSQIDEFPDYSVSSLGRVRSSLSDRVLAQSLNPQGFPKLNLRYRGITYTRQVNILVATTFCDPPAGVEDEWILHKDGDAMNCRADNLVWRSRAFVARYKTQFDSTMPKGYSRPVFDFETGEMFHSSIEAARHYGLLITDILDSANDHTTLYPTAQEFVFAD